MSAAPAVAAPSASPSPPEGQKVCDVNDSRLGQDAVTGMAATAKGFDVINDNDSLGTVQVYQISTSCQVQPLVQDPNTPDTPEDLAVTPDGAIWVADIGDAQKQRQHIAIWKFANDQQDGAQLYHLSYPDGPHDAAAMLVSASGTVAIVTKDPGSGGVYVPTGALSTDQTVPMKKVGVIQLAATGTSGGPLGELGQKVFTGGAVSPDGKHAVLRTYTDAYEWNVTGGDVASSVVKGKPVRTPLPNEPDGEAISFSTDGKSFLTMADAHSVVIDRYTPATASATKPSAAATADGGGLFGNLTVTDITNIVIVIGVIGLILLAAGLVGVRRARRQPFEDDPVLGAPGDPFDDSETAVIPRYTDGGPPPSSSRRRTAPPRRPSPDDVQTDVIGVVREEPPPPRKPRGTARPSRPSQPDTGWSASSRWRDEERPRGGRNRDRFDEPYDRERPPPRRGRPDDEPEPYRPRSR